MPATLTPALLTLVVVAVTMIGEARISTRNERALRARGALEPGRDVYPLMQVVYPLSFVAIAIEGALFGVASPALLTIAVALFVVAKLLKYWVIATLGDRWTFRVLVPVGEPLVVRGPYRWLSHPNYVAVVGELGSLLVDLKSGRPQLFNRIRYPG